MFRNVAPVFSEKITATLLKNILLAAILATAAFPLIIKDAHSHKAHGDGEEESRSSLINPLGFEAPAPGSYRLPPIQQAVDGDVVDADGKKHRLFDLMTDKYVVFSFIYTACADPKGCPLASFTLNHVWTMLEKDPSLAKKVRFVTLSFDLEKDTPEALRRYTKQLGFEEARRTKRWRFLTTASSAELKPILDGYGQYVVREFDKNGRQTGYFSHVLKVYLIDPKRRVRNIYSTSFLYPELIVNDIKTMMMERAEVQ